MTTLVYTHEACLEHIAGPMHPEGPARLEAVERALADDSFAELRRLEAPRAAREQLERVHPPEYVDRVAALIPESGYAAIDSDTVASPGSWEAALRAAGAACAAVDAVMKDEAQTAFCAVRPPGHHAEPERAMGFCFFNNIAIGALQARAVHGCHRVAVMDFDVHHGNGTQAAFWDDPDLMLCSTHQMPLYPGTGHASERGAHDNIVNVPLAPFAGSAEFRKAMSDHVLPRLSAFDADLIMISAGFDAHEGDPLAALRFQDEDFSWATRQIMRIAAHSCGGRVVSTLEGGYDLDALASSVAAHVEALMGD